jgi:hypothetical protein
MFYLELQQVHTYHTRNHYIKGQSEAHSHMIYVTVHFFFYKFKLHDLLRESVWTTTSRIKQIIMYIPICLIKE